ncbi:ABC transporter ATP-binding protein|uniref:Iron complex transport system ATP-binding protein n=1 Tax=Dendrosporobacter quercicolus TaxID=146817 RepID=A0A1G9Y1X2_9FIRM|nr:ABC transporter ATP-binding protein [Dendrosporobacter quercicolus]NSL49018.1 ABC transporter ATP-binding protein [Dendrosporobacter quercicolus DSM 1736]SDN02666.1 iron complex transport system ATP-binding protein [Dendrosporobacter quercicolus]
MGILKADNLEIRYDRQVIFTGLDFLVQTGRITTIIGPNGCGKSTMLKALGRILKPQSGAVYLDGQDMRSLDTRDIASRLALLPQNPVAPNELKVEELIGYGRFPHRGKGPNQAAADRQAIERAMEMTNIARFRKRALGSLSGGERQKVWLAMALAQETEVLLLDEPTTYLDIVHQLDVLKIVRQLNRERQCTVVMVLHDINQAARFSHVIAAVKQGRVIACGSPQQIVTPEVLKQVFSIEARIMFDSSEGVPVCFSYDNPQSDAAACQGDE